MDWTAVVVTGEILLAAGLLAGRLLPLAERLVALREGAIRQRQAESIEVPSDLRAIAGRESEAWARDSEIARYRELFVDLGSWDKVREVTIHGH